jgi:AraC family transcriptional regulator
MSSLESYAERFARVFEYIEAHLDGDLCVERLAQVAAFSKFHFHRQFSNYAGIGVARYVQTKRLDRASFRLAFEPAVRIVDIALEAGFETPESFARAFKREFGQTPSQFRISPAWKALGRAVSIPRIGQENDNGCEDRRIPGNQACGA